MQTYSELKPVTTTSQFESPSQSSPLKDSTSVILIAMLAGAVAIEVVKIFGLSHGMSEHMRTELSWIGMSICFVSAPTFLIFGRKLPVRVGFGLVAGLIFAVSVIASMVA
ncbi:MAG TPA: hypothetical protein V6C89_21365 [Drouetiella sp.]|jgi:hypothetical protein